MKPRNLRVLVIWDSIIGEEPSANYRIAQLAALAKRGHIVTWVTARTSKHAGNTGEPTFILQTLLLHRIVPLASFLLFQLFAVRRLIASINRSDAIILEVGTVPVLFPFLILRRLCSPSPALFLRVSTNPVETGGHLKTLYLHFVDALSLRLSAKFFDRIFFISPMMAQWYSARYRIHWSKIGVWPSGVGMNFFEQPSRHRVHRLRKQIGPSDQLAVLYHGALSRRRGVIEMVEAFRILTDESIRATLVVLANNGPAKEEIWKYIVSNGLEEVVQLCGPVSYLEVPDYIAACDVGIVPLPDHPWWRYQCPIKLLECLAMNKPVIVSKIPANTWVVGSAPVATYLEGTNPREIANGVRAFLLHRNTLDPKMGRQIAADFSVEKIAEMIERQVISVFH